MLAGWQALQQFHCFGMLQDHICFVLHPLSNVSLPVWVPPNTGWVSHHENTLPHRHLHHWGKRPVKGWQKWWCAVYQFIHSSGKDILRRKRVIFFPEKFLVLQALAWCSDQKCIEMVLGTICYSIWPVFWGYRLMAAKVCVKCSVSYLVHRRSLEKKRVLTLWNRMDGMGMWCGSSVGKPPFSRAQFGPVTLTVKLLSSNTASPKIPIQSKWLTKVAIEESNEKRPHSNRSRCSSVWK